MKAAHKKQMFPFNNQDIEIRPGQFISGRNKGAEEIGVSPQKYRTAINYLKSTSRITTQPTNRFTVFTILNWDLYQNSETANQRTNQQLTSHQPATNQPLTTYKNVKNDNKTTTMFDIFWKVYPKKVSKGYAIKVFNRIKPSKELLEKMVSAIEEQKLSEQWSKDNGQYIPNPSTWLNGEKWTDELFHKETLEEKHARLMAEGEI